MKALEHVDVLIVGAGLSGIGAACQLSMACPQKTFVILEGRESMGGTWDLFRYPGVRSDSDSTFRVNYAVQPSSIPVISAADLLNGEADAGRVAGPGELTERFNGYFFGPMDYAIVGRKVEI